MNRIIDRIITILEANVKTPRNIKKVYKGDPVFIPNVNMPAITVNPQETRIIRLDSCQDYKEQIISIVVILDARTYFNTSDSETGLFELAKIMEEEESTGRIKSDTILGALRENFYDDRAYIHKTENESVSYGFAEREFPTIDCELTFTVYGKPYTRDL